MAYTVAMFTWFGAAVGSYTQIGPVAGGSILVLAAPLFQPQIMAFALVRQWVGRRHGPGMRAFAGAAAWVACEWLFPKLLGDTLGHGLYPSEILRQGADLGGASGLTVLLLWVNEGVCVAISRRTQGVRSTIQPLIIAALFPLLLGIYGYSVLSTQQAVGGNSIRVGMVQANLSNYEEQRNRSGAHAVVREVLDTHFSMSYEAVVRQHADAVLWSETIYPTTFGSPKSEVGGELDQEILDIVKSAGVPFVFGTYDTHVHGEYNAAAFVTPDGGLLGFYHKTRLFLFTEYVPEWLDGPNIRRWFPWTGHWQKGEGARVFPLHLADGREIPVLPLICLDDVDTGLAIDGARMGAQAILTMSNDAWFTDHPQGAALHQAVAAFRSIETRLPQFRVTTNGYSSAIDATGRAVVGSNMGERTLVMGDLQVGAAKTTLMVLWGDWVGRVGAVLIILMIFIFVVAKFFPVVAPQSASTTRSFEVPVKVWALPPAARLAAGLLRAFARLSLLFLGFAMLFSDSLRGNTLAQLHSFFALFVVPEVAAWLVLSAFKAWVTFENDAFVITKGKHRLELAYQHIAAASLWRLPVPGSGISIRMQSDNQGSCLIMLDNPGAWIQALAFKSGNPTLGGPLSLSNAYAHARQALERSALDDPLVKFILLPTLLSLVAFHVHQQIVFGSGLGEYHLLGLKVFITSFSNWWISWVIGVVLCAAQLRALIEVGTLLSVLQKPLQAILIRAWLERLGRALLYLGLPMWLIFQVLGFQVL